MLPDSPDRRLLVELTSHAADLAEAAEALSLALEAGDGSALWQPLTMHATTAYVRPFIHSNVRRRLDQMPGFSIVDESLGELRSIIRQYRNTSVAHSQSSLSTFLVTALLGDDGHVRKVGAIGIHHPMTLDTAERFCELIAIVEASVERMSRPIVDSLLSTARRVAPEVVASWPGPRISSARDVDFSSASSRAHEPHFTAYWRVEEHP